MALDAEKALAQHFQCGKCHSTESEIGVVTTQGGAISSMLRMPMNRFLKVTCARCGYTDLFDKMNFEKWIGEGNSPSTLFAPKQAGQ